MRYRIGSGLAAVLLSVAACTPQLVPDYDEQIDQGLSQLNTDVAAFVARMNQAAGTPAGAYAANKDFYITEDARIDTLVLRAEAHRALNTCPSTGLVAGILAKAVPGSDVQKYAASLPSDDCTVVLLQELRAAFGDLQQFHEDNGAGGIPAAADPRFMSGGLGSLIRVAITVEIAKKTHGKDAGGNGS